jgi:outer membrane protein OmpA-like peptidoglycan-associated protein
MTLRFIAAGLAVALLASPVALAQTQNDQFVVAAADTDVTQYLNETRPLSSLSVDELKQRARAGRQLMKGGSLSKDDKKKVRAAMQAAAQELKSRGSADKADMSDDEAGSTGQATTSDSSSATTDQKQKKKADQQVAEGSTQTAASGDVAAFLADTRSLDSMDEKALRQKQRAARALIKGGTLSQADRAKVRDVMKAIRAALKKRGKDSDEADDTDDMQGQAEQQTNQDASASAGGAGAEYLADTRPLAQFSDKDLQQRMRQGRQLMKGGSLSQADQKKVQAVVRAAWLEIAKRGGKGGQQDSGDETMDNTGQAGGGASMDSQVVADNTDSAKLDDQVLRKRLKAARDQLSGNTLSPTEKKALRQKLAGDRRELRQRVAKKTGKGDVDSQASGDWLQDKREAKALNDRELEGRLAFYRAQLGKGNVTPEDQARFRVILDNDRQEFRTRALAMKNDRYRKLKNRVASKQLNIEIDINPPEPPAPVWADEADDQMIVTQLVRRPARKFDRRYTFEEVTAEPELRAAMPAVEINTVTFGFNEDFVREEQLENLDRIGQILEEILAEHPQEVFLVEGHTDAVGDDAYNLDLSSRRADAIKSALTEYYAIGPENLKTVGYGERYLKIDTEEPEEENRRITIRRITPAIGGLEG